MDLRFGRCRLPEHLNRLKMSQSEFAIRLGVSKSMVSQYMTGEKKFSLLKAKIAADILGIHIEDLYEWVLFKNGKR
ncbi:helix-turn-helix protein [Paenibacillus cellulosilyticus]|uniref:Helix-turn-helix protein n=1 Tax=Paenibacillus cellulosilyticus TaxID=375489 RepID=A0A2V2YT13_9BACL|nr:helix-turn-helix protein [Paenibacillus cellulosilyticus]